MTLLPDPELAAGRRVQFLSGDDASAKATVRSILEKAGFFAVDLGALDVGGPLASIPLGPLVGVNLLKI